MIDSLKRFFGKNEGKAGQEPEPGKCHDIRIATCALFLEMAKIDGEFTETEREKILRALKREHDLSGDAADDLLQAAEHELKHRVDLWQFTRLINENYSHEEKLRIVEMLWKIVYTDGRLDKHEDYLVHKLSNLLNLSHKELIDSKLEILHGGKKAGRGASPENG
jgi:uncharacterized tellurite resistance protein B-like protein